MDIAEHTPTGVNIRTLSTAEVIARAKTGDRNAINELITAKGGWAVLTSAQKEKVTLLILGQDVAL